MGNPQTIALTATATGEVRDDIAQQLALASPKTHVAGFARPNLFYCVVDASTQDGKLKTIVDLLRDQQGAAIIYAATRRACDDLVVTLAAQPELSSRCVGVYHAGLTPERRRQVQEQFMEGQIDVIVATNAFGMGINKADVRSVIHYQIPGTIEAYYQEAGRAGRDGHPATCMLLHSEADRYIQEFFIDNAHPPADVIRQIYEYLRSETADPLEVTQQEIQTKLDLSISPDCVGQCERILESQGVLERLEAQQNMAGFRIDSDLPTLVDLLPVQAIVQRKVVRGVERVVGTQRNERVSARVEDVARLARCDLAATRRALRELRQLAQFDYVPPFRGRALRLLRRDLSFDDLGLDLEPVERRRQRAQEKLDSTFRYARAHRCRQYVILDYFGETGESMCGHCDTCAQCRDAGTVMPPWSVELEQVVLMVLSAVFRGRGRFGKRMIAAMLCGSTSQKVRRWQLDRLSTFGLLRHLQQIEVIRLIDELVEERLLMASEVERRRPTLRLTERGDDVMRGKTPFAGPLCVAPELHAKLLATPLRGRVGSVGSDGSDGSVGSVGSVRSVVPNSHLRHREAAHVSERPSYYWTWRLLRDEYSVAECALVRNVDESVVWDDAIRAAQAGFDVDCDWLLDTGQQELLAEYVAGAPNSGRAELVHGLPKTLRPQQLHWYLATCRTRRHVEENRTSRIEIIRQCRYNGLPCQGSTRSAAGRA